MKKFSIICDRCQTKIDGLISDIPSTGRSNRYTVGFYDMISEKWNRFARDGETYVCDTCMHADIEYTRIYAR